MRLNISKRLLKAGEIIEVTWDSEEGNNPRLILNTGNRQSTLSVPLNGSKKFRLKGNKGHHSVKLVANVYGKEKTITKHIYVYGKKEETDEFEYVDRGDASPINRWNNGIQQWWQSFSSEKKRLYILLLLLIAYNMMSSLPSVASIAPVVLYGIILWLFWQIVKR